MPEQVPSPVCGARPCFEHLAGYTRHGFCSLHGTAAELSTDAIGPRSPANNSRGAATIRPAHGLITYL